MTNKRVAATRNEDVETVGQKVVTKDSKPRKVLVPRTNNVHLSCAVLCRHVRYLIL